MAFLLLSSVPPGGEWVSVPRPQRIPHQLEEDDLSIWAVFAKSFGEERILVRFPDDPLYHRKNGNFTASSLYGGVGEFTLIVQKKEKQREGMAVWEYVYSDPEQPGIWIHERHIESDENLYVLRFMYPVNDPDLFSKFADSFEIEKNSDFHR